jgi:exodeoxyribonuclease VII large subunit
VGIVTSPTGAVIRDFLNIVARRHSGLNVLLFPVSVQGDQAPAEIEAALAALNQAGLADVLVLARGGGSLEDLAAFNSERVARAIVASRLPVVSAIGHETDFTIADFVADLRAPTPSAAAELITAAQHKIAEYLATLVQRLDRAARFQLLGARQQLGQLPFSRIEARVASQFRRSAQRLDDLTTREESAFVDRLRLLQARVAELCAAVLHHDPRRQLAHASQQLQSLRIHLDRALERQLRASASSLTSLEARLNSLSPLAVLDRGYALVLDAEGALVRSASKVAKGDQLTTRLADGTFVSKVQSSNAAQAPPKR